MCMPAQGLHERVGQLAGRLVAQVVADAPPADGDEVRRDRWPDLRVSGQVSEEAFGVTSRNQDGPGRVGRRERLGLCLHLVELGLGPL